MRNKFSVILPILVLTLWCLSGGEAIHDPALIGIKTKSYHRDPIIEQALKNSNPYQAHQHHQHQQVHEQNEFVDDGNYQLPYGDPALRLSQPIPEYGPDPSNNHGYHHHGFHPHGPHPHGPHPHGPHPHGPHSHPHHFQEQEPGFQMPQEPLYDRNNIERHAYVNPVRSDWSDAENTITEYYTGCPPHHTGPLPYAYDCRRFINCYNGRSHIQSCGPGTVFNPETLECDRPDKVRCGVNTALGKDFERQSSPSLKTGNVRAQRLLDTPNKSGNTNGDNLCPPGKTGLFPHPYDCGKFLNCANGETFVQECGPGTGFSVTMKVCDFLHKVDCGARSGGGPATRRDGDGAGRQYENPSNGYGNREPKAYSNSQPPRRDYGGYSNNRESFSGHRQPSSGYNDRWTSMNMPRPDAKAYNPPPASASPQWSGAGYNVQQELPEESVVYEEGSLQPNRNYHQTLSTPLAPMRPPHSSNHFSPSPPAEEPNVYYAQPVLSNEDTPDDARSHVFGTNPSHLSPLKPIHDHQPRRNYSREIGFSSPPENKWTPIVRHEEPSKSFPQNPQRPYRPNYDGYKSTINIPDSRLLPPLQTDSHQRPLPDSSYRPVTQINLDDLPAEGQFDLTNLDLYPAASNFDDSNLFGGLQPPPKETSPITPNSDLQPPFPSVDSFIPTPSNSLEPPTQGTTPSSNVRTFQIYPPVENISKPINHGAPHYSSPYSGVNHSRKQSPPRVNPRNGFPPEEDEFLATTTTEKYPRNPLSRKEFENEGSTTEKRGLTPRPFNRQYYKPSESLPPQTEEEENPLVSQLPVSEALKALLRPYMNRSGLVSEDEAQKAESHIMSLLPRASLDTTTTSTTTPRPRSFSTPSIPTTIRYKPKFVEVEAPDDVELILAGEQHNLITVTVPTPTTKLSTVKSNFQLNKPPSRNGASFSSPPSTPALSPDQETNCHNREFHLRHPHIPNPFKTNSTSPESPTAKNQAFRNPFHRHHHPHHHGNHPCGPMHPKQPNEPNKPNTYPTREGDPSLDKPLDEFDVPNKNAESTTTPESVNIDPRFGSIDKDEEKCEFDCGNGKCVKSFEVCDGVNNCGNRKDESKCEHLGYEVRLSGGETPNVGRVEVKILGKWGYVCDDKFGLRDADVVCKELGFQLGAMEVRGNSFYAPTETNPSFIMDEVDCKGNETSLKDCDFKGWGINNCQPDEVAGVACKVPQLKCPKNYWLCKTSNECLPTAFVCDNTPDCEDHSDESEETCNAPVKYRLDGGRSPNEGRLEVFYRGQWGTVCDDDFGLKEAQVACNSFGFYGKPTIEKNIFGPGKGPIWLDQVACFGNETAIDKCSHWTWGEHNCNHTEDVGLKCSAGPPPRTTKTALPEKPEPESLEDDQTILEDIGFYSYGYERSSKVLQPQRKCGHFKEDLFDAYKHPEEERILNGTVAPRGRHPWQATIRLKGRGGISSHWCGAVLISKKHLLTAAHCLVGYQKGAYFVRLGDHYANVAESSEIDSFIENWYIHEKFRHKTHMNNDIALIVLKNPVRFNDYIQPICLPEKDAPLEPKRLCTISGWGSIKSGTSTPSNILRAAQVPLLPEDVCKQAHVYGASMTEGMFCAGHMDENVDACDGDSGGPLVCNDGDAETLYGIISWGQHCGYANKPGVYVRVEKYIDWIYEKINHSLQH